MEFFQKKKFLPIFIATIVVAGTTIIVYATKNHQSISENEVRSQLEQMYSAEVANLTMGQDQDTYEAIITKSGAIYMVEMNAVTGDVLSLTQTDEYIIKEKVRAADESVEIMKDEPKTVVAKIESKNEEKLSAKTESKVVKEVKITVNPEKSKTVDDVKTTKTVEKSSVKTADTTPVKAEEKVTEQKDEKPIKNVIKEVIKDILKSDSSKTEDEKVEQVKEDISKTETAKSDVDKTEEGSKTEVQPLVDGQKSLSSLAQSQQDVAKADTETKSAPAATVLISEEQAIKIAQQQYKGMKENISFVKTNEGGYYLILMKASAPESGTKESGKGKATIQVHAISGKILSVTLE